MVRKNLFSLIIALVILILSFTSSGTFNRLHIPHIPNLDKIVHVCMYFSLMLALVIENRSILSDVKSYIILASIPVLFGGIIEIMQSMFTTSRTGDIMDFCFNVAGIILSVVVWLLLKRFLKLAPK